MSRLQTRLPLLPQAPQPVLLRRDPSPKHQPERTQRNMVPRRLPQRSIGVRGRSGPDRQPGGGQLVELTEMYQVLTSATGAEEIEAEFTSEELVH